MKAVFGRDLPKLLTCLNASTAPDNTRQAEEYFVARLIPKGQITSDFKSLIRLL